MSVSAAAEGPTKKNGGSDEVTTRSADQGKAGGVREPAKDGSSQKGEDRIDMEKETRGLRGALCSMDRFGVQRKLHGKIQRKV